MIHADLVSAPGSTVVAGGDFHRRQQRVHWHQQPARTPRLRFQGLKLAPDDLNRPPLFVLFLLFVEFHFQSLCNNAFQTPNLASKAGFEPQTFVMQSLRSLALVS